MRQCLCHALTALLVIFAATFAAIDGTALVMADGKIVQIPVVASTPGAFDSVFTQAEWGSSWKDNAGIMGPCFSPDGKRMAFAKKDWYGPAFGGETNARAIKIFTASNDGSSLDTICAGVNAKAGNVFMSWDDNGYLWWSEQTKHVYRVNLLTRQRETHRTLDDFTGDDPPDPYRIDAIKVSRAGTRAGFMLCGVGHCMSLDFTTNILRDYDGGCQGTVSPNGQLVTHSSGMSGYSFHQVGYIHDFETKAIVDTFFAPGAVPGASGSVPRIVTIRFSHSSNEHIVFKGEDAIGGQGYVHDLTGNETVLLGECGPSDYWNGALPTHNDPFISLSPTMLIFSSDGSAPPSQDVTVTNDGGGSLGALTTTVLPTSATWLTATAGSGTVTTSVDPGGLAAGTYTATVAVEGGAQNAGVYTVVFNNQTGVAAPTGLYLGDTWKPASSIGTAWQDNADNEDGFILERMAEGGSWETVDTVPANTTSYLDTVPTVGYYTYRVRAYAGTDLSGYSNEASMYVSFTPTITVLAPAAGDTAYVGDTTYIQWTTDGVTNIEIKYSVNDGEDWLSVTTTGSVGTDSADWGNYAWVVPDIVDDSVLIMVHAYSDQPLNGQSDYFVVAQGQTGTHPRLAGHRPVAADLRGSGTFSFTGDLRFRYGLADGETATLDIYRLNGALVTRVPLARTPGLHEAAWCGGADRKYYLGRLRIE